METLEQVYGAASSKIKKNAKKQALSTLGVTALATTGAYFNLKERRKAATKMKDFHTSIRPLISQKETAYNDGFVFWKNHKAMNETYKQDEENWDVSFRNKRRDELKELWKDKELDALQFDKIVENDTNKSLASYQKQMDLYAEFKPYQKQYEKTTGKTIYLKPIKKHIDRVEQQIARSSSLGSKLLEALNLQPSSDLEDVEFSDGFGKATILRLPKSNASTAERENFLNNVNSSKNIFNNAQKNRLGFVVNRERIDSRKEVLEIIKTRARPTSDQVKMWESYLNIAEGIKQSDANRLSTSDSILNQMTLPNKTFTQGRRGIFRLPLWQDGDGNTSHTYVSSKKYLINMFDTNEQFRDAVGNFQTGQAFWESIRSEIVTKAHAYKEILTNTDSQYYNQKRFNDEHYLEAAIKQTYKQLFKSNGETGTVEDIDAFIQNNLIDYANGLEINERIDPRKVEKIMYDEYQDAITSSTYTNILSDKYSNTDSTSKILTSDILKTQVAVVRRASTDPQTLTVSNFLRSMDDVINIDFLAMSTTTVAGNRSKIEQAEFNYRAATSRVNTILDLNPDLIEKYPAIATNLKNKLLNSEWAKIIDDSAQFSGNMGNL